MTMGISWVLFNNLAKKLAQLTGLQSHRLLCEGFAAECSLDYEDWPRPLNYSIQTVSSKYK
jgi:hypothetical protein